MTFKIFPAIFFQTIIFLFIYFTYSTPTLTAQPIRRGETDKLALLAFKANIKDDPLQILSSWNDSSHFCTWFGVFCLPGNRRVGRLELDNSSFTGSLSPHLGNLTAINKIWLTNNKLVGEIPSELGYLSELQYLDVSNNSLSGAIPPSLSNCSKLISLGLGYNMLTGILPVELGLLSNLESLMFHFNYLRGEIPSSFANFSFLGDLSGASSGLEGIIPDIFTNLKNLYFLGLAVNNLTGTLPPSLYNLSFIETISISVNHLEGSLPADLSLKFPNLRNFLVDSNKFTGLIPASLSNSSSLEKLGLLNNQFTGKVDIDFGCMLNFYWLSLGFNNLGVGEENDLKFLSTLTNCSNLMYLGVHHNQFWGLLSTALLNLSAQLQTIEFWDNQLYGHIPAGIERFVNLEKLDLEGNYLSGSIPTGLCRLQKIKYMSLHKTGVSGELPSCLGNLTLLNTLHLDENHLEGSVPLTIGECRNLNELDLSQNKLSGHIPEELLSLASLTISLNLSHNNFSGPLPQNVGRLDNLAALDISENKLYGEIPSSLSSCITLVQLSLSGNFLQGNIPSSLRVLRGLDYLDLSCNNLSGKIPEYLEHFSFLIHLNLSFNDFEGEVPTGGIFKNLSGLSLVGNTKLCGGLDGLKLPKCRGGNSHSRKYLVRTVLEVTLLVLLIVILILSLIKISSFVRLIWSTPKKEKEPLSGSQLPDRFIMVTYEMLSKATGGFSTQNLIGRGSVCTVFKGILETDCVEVAVKVLNLRERVAYGSFLAECKALENARHRNLVKILSACCTFDPQGNEFKALVYELVPNGNLESWLHTNNTPKNENERVEQSRYLSLLQRLNIAIDVVSALEYLHNFCLKKMVHCDLKPSNILLDNNMTARVGDFGLAKFLPTSGKSRSFSRSSSVNFNGTIGYAAPEYGMGSKVSTQGDMYSFGILLLEMFTAKRPTNPIFKDGLNLRSFVMTAIPTGVMDIVDPLLLSIQEENAIAEIVEGRIGSVNRENIEECLISVIKIGIACSMDAPENRMEIIDAAKELVYVRDLLIQL